MSKEFFEWSSDKYTLKNFPTWILSNIAKLTVYRFVMKEFYLALFCPSLAVNWSNSQIDLMLGNYTSCCDNVTWNVYCTKTFVMPFSHYIWNEFTRELNQVSDQPFGLVLWFEVIRYQSTRPTRLIADFKLKNILLQLYREVLIWKTPSILNFTWTYEFLKNWGASSVFYTRFFDFFVMLNHLWTTKVFWKIYIR